MNHCECADSPFGGRRPPFTRRTVVVDGTKTSYLEAGSGVPVVLLLHGGEFGGGAEICWERIIPLLAKRHRVVAPDILGFGQTDKVVDFLDGRGRRIAHLARFCDIQGLEECVVVGNSMGGALALYDASQPRPRLPATKLVSITGGGRLRQSPHTDALFDYDGSIEGMRRIVRALFADESWAHDEGYVSRRHQLSIAPGAWEAIAAARFQRPHLDEQPPATSRAAIDYGRIDTPTLIISGAEDKIKPPGWADELCAEFADAQHVEIPNTGHCPQIEDPAAVLAALLPFLQS